MIAALADTQLEMAERKSDDPFRAAKGREAHANVNLWLSHAENDFLAINDLAYGEEGKPRTPARFSQAERVQELTGWAARAAEDREPAWPAIDCRSYATLGRCPFDERWQEQQEEPPPTSRLTLVRDRLEDVWALLRRNERRGKSDFVYRVTYQLCANPPFRAPSGAAAKDFWSGERVQLASWHNDGIVNTASMPWARGETLLVHADHGDIIGHFDFKASTELEPGRKYRV